MNARIIILAWLASVALSSCCFDNSISCDDIDPDEPHTALLRLDADWSEFGNEPTGMTVALHPDSGARFEESSNDVRTMYLNVENRRYRLLLNNLTPGEFSSMNFSDMNMYDAAHTTLAPLVRTNQAWDKGVTYSQEPEALAISTDTFDLSNGWAAAADAQIVQGDTIIYIIRETPRPVVTTLTVRVSVNGINNARSVEGSISGMANGYMLTQWHSTTDTTRMLLSGWKATLDTTDRNGYIETTIQTFALPYSAGEELSQRSSNSNMLQLYFRLHDNNTAILCSYNVGSLFKYIDEDGQPTNRHTLNMLLDIGDAIELPDVPGDKGNSSGFDADVEPWDDGDTKDVTF